MVNVASVIIFQWLEVDQFGELREVGGGGGALGCRRRLQEEAVVVEDLAVPVLKWIKPRSRSFSTEILERRRRRLSIIGSGCSRVQVIDGRGVGHLGEQLSGGGVNRSPLLMLREALVMLRGRIMDGEHFEEI